MLEFPLHQNSVTLEAIMLGFCYIRIPLFGSYVMSQFHYIRTPLYTEIPLTDITEYIAVHTQDKYQ